MHGTLPYTTDVRPDTGLTNPKLAIWLFLASEVMLFASLFSSYALLRSFAPTWPDQSAVLSVPLATFNTIILITSSVTMVLSWVAAKARRFERFRLHMGLTLALGGAFLVVKAFEYGDKFSHGLVPATDNFLGLYFGMVVNAYLLWPGARMWHTEPERFINRVEVSGIYWHFVDVVWIFLFPVLYLL
jgi:heme/copper-type cytochrome/quinol oxidase subunit 3